MNRSILIVICDFLLVSLLAFSTVDANRLTHPGSVTNLQLNQPAAVTNQAAAKQDLGEAMRLALADEQKNRLTLLSELEETRGALSNQQSQLSQRAGQLQTYQQQMRAGEERARQLQQEIAGYQTNLQSLNSRLQQTAAESALSQEQRAALEAQARRQSEQANALQQQLTALQRSNEVFQAQNRDLSTQLLTSESARQAAAAQLVTMRDEVTAQREENAKLTEGVQALASKSQELAQQIRSNTPLAPNVVFNDFVTNRIDADFKGVRAGLFGGAASSRQASTVLVTDGANVFGVCHVQDSPIVLGTPGASWENLTCTLNHNGVTIPVTSVTFSATDPRVLLIPVSNQAAHQLGVRVYRLSSDPYKFEDAVVVGAKEGYYGECRFQIDVSTPGYFKMDRSTLRGLFGKFNPSSGDLVLSRTGELLGVMANNTYCVHLHSAAAQAAFALGPQIKDQGTSETISSLYSMVANMPYKLQ